MKEILAVDLETFQLHCCLSVDRWHSLHFAPSCSTNLEAKQKR